MAFRLKNELKVDPGIDRKIPAVNVQTCAGGIMVRNNKFLFGKRSKSKDWAPGVWDIVGGKSLKGELPLFTLQREVFEETGTYVLNAELLTVADVSSRDSEQSLFKYFIYVVTDFKGKPDNKTKEHTKLKWYTRQEINDIHIALPEYLNLIDTWLALKSNL